MQNFIIYYCFSVITHYHHILTNAYQGSFSSMTNLGRPTTLKIVCWKLHFLSPCHKVDLLLFFIVHCKIIKKQKSGFIALYVFGSLCLQYESSCTIANTTVHCYRISYTISNSRFCDDQNQRNTRVQSQASRHMAAPLQCILLKLTMDVVVC